MVVPLVFYLVFGLVFHFVLRLVFHLIFGLMFHFVFALVFPLVLPLVGNRGGHGRSLVLAGVRARRLALDRRGLTAPMTALPVVVSSLLARVHLRLGGRAAGEPLAMVDFDLDPVFNLHLALVGSVVVGVYAPQQ